MAVTAVYLDNNATTSVDRRVVEAMQPLFSKVFGNASSLHRLGREARRLVEAARGQVATAIGAEASEVVFTSGGTESNNLAVRGLADSPRLRHFVTSQVEHPSVRRLADLLARRGCEVESLPVDSNGQLDLARLEDCLRPGESFVSLMAANNETGIRWDIAKIAGICRSLGVPVHVDGVQALGKQTLLPTAWGVDLLSLSGHKIHGPKGVGALYVRRGVRLAPLQVGGEQEAGMRPGTENVPAIVGFGRACEILATEGGQARSTMRELRDGFERELRRICPDVVIHGSRVERLPNTSSFSLPGVESLTMLRLLDRRGICISEGSACSSGVFGPSHVIQALGVSHEVAQGTVRLSLSRMTTREDVSLALHAIQEVVALLAEDIAC